MRCALRHFELKHVVRQAVYTYFCWFVGLFVYYSLGIHHDYLELVLRISPIEPIVELVEHHRIQ